VEKHFIHSTMIFNLQIITNEHADILPKLREILKQYSMKVQSFSIQKDLAQDTSVLEVVVHAHENSPLEELAQEIHNLPGVRIYKVG